MQVPNEVIANAINAIGGAGIIGLLAVWLKSEYKRRREKVDDQKELRDEWRDEVHKLRLDLSDLVKRYQELIVAHAELRGKYIALESAHSILQEEFERRKRESDEFKAIVIPRKP
jgi:predicted nuclease with TOPRIM domain